jgi:hypothetical protein
VLSATGKNVIGKYNNIAQIIIKTLNNINPNKNPCGTPDNTSKCNARAAELRTHDSLPVR